MKPISFIHVPKCGGTSVKELLEPHYKERGWYGFTPAIPNWDDVDCVIGHVAWNELCNRHAMCCTLLRHPVDIFESWMNYRIDTVENSIRYREDVREMEANLDRYIDLNGADGDLLLKWFINDCGQRASPDLAVMRLAHLDLLGFLDQFDVFVENLGQMLEIDLKEPLHANKSKSKVRLSQDQRAFVAWKYRSDVAAYQYAEQIWRHR